MILLEMTDARAADIPGEWADKSDNRYILNKDRTLRMISKSGTETEGAYSLSEKKGEEGKLLLTMVFDGSVLDFQYELSEDGNTLTLSTPDVSHVWTKVS